MPLSRTGDAVAPLLLSPSPISPAARRQARVATLLLLSFAFVVRLLVLASFHYLTHGAEINDDYRLYEVMIRRPFLLLTGVGFEQIGEGGIYAPLVPLQLWFPGGLISYWTGPLLGRRLGMLAYDLSATAIALRVAFYVAGPPSTRLQWIAAALLVVLPASVGASVVWGQEDSAAALWSAAALASFVWIGPLASMLVAGAGLFTSKMFCVVLMLGIWLASPGHRLRTTIAAVSCVAAFGVFLLLRWLGSGFLYPDYHYHAMSNSPSIWALYYLLIDPLKFDDSIRPFVKILAAISMLTLVGLLWRRRLTVWSAVVASHCVFFASFIGIHPEHYQWFLPFLIVFAWDAMRRGRKAAFALSVGITFLAYAYKIVYGLRGPAGNTAGGKQSIRDVFERYAGFDLYWIQVGLAFFVLGSLLLLARAAMREDTRLATAT